MKKKIGICGCTGHVVKFGELVNSFAESEVTVVWDYDQPRGKQVADQLQVPFEADYDAVLNNYGLDGVLIITENKYKAELILRAAEHRISVFVEKPMCVKLEEAYAIQKAVHDNNVKFFMTDPFVRSGTLKIEQLIKDGSLGNITEASIRIAQLRPRFEQQFSRETSQGGIMADIGGHAIHIAHYLFGKPQKISSVLIYKTPYAKEQQTETNAYITMVYPDDLTVSLECSFDSRGLENHTIVRGDKATACIVPKETMREGEEVVEVYTDRIHKEVISDLPQNPKRHIRYFVEMLVYDYPNDIVGRDPLSNSGVSIDHAVEYVEIINTIYQNANRGLVEVI